MIEKLEALLSDLSEEVVAALSVERIPSLLSRTAEEADPASVEP